MSKLVDMLTQNLTEADISDALLSANIAAEISIARVKMGMTQKKFAKYLGVSQGMVSRIESGNSNYTFSTANKILNKIGKRLSTEIIDLEEAPALETQSATVRIEKPKSIPVAETYTINSNFKAETSASASVFFVTPTHKKQNRISYAN